MVRQFDYSKTIWGTEVPRRGNLKSSGTLILGGVLMSLSGVSGKILDVGCGGGQFSRAVKKYRPDLEVVGIDAGKDAISYAKKMSKRIDCKVADATNLPLKDSEFDAVISIEVLEHIKEYKKMISEIRRVLKPNGVVYLSVSCEKSLWTIPGVLGLLGFDYTRKSFGHINKLSYKDLLSDFKKAGFEIRKIFYFGHIIRQIEDFLYAMYLRRARKKPGDLWEEHRGERSLKDKFIFSLFKLAILATNIESKILWWFPGISIQIEAIKQ